MKKTFGVTSSHTTTETWEKTDYRCPSCGNTKVWKLPDRDAGVWYLSTYNCMCIACESVLNIMVRKVSPDTPTYKTDAQRLQNLREMPGINEP